MCGKLAFGQTAEGSLNSQALESYDKVYAYLNDQGIVDWTSATVPDKYAMFVESLVALSLANILGVPNERYQRIRADASNAIPEIRRTFARQYKSSQTKIGNF